MSMTPPADPTKFLAVGSFSTPPTPEQNAAILPKQVPAVLRLYVDGKIDQFWYRLDGKGVVFVMTTASAAEAAALLAALPFGQAGLMEFELIPIGPLTPLARLITDEEPTAAH